jgi:6-pyruvoyltetrahydropterin/6-carboxytetrahydropterin synthase
MVYLTRRYRFCAGHRLHNEVLSEEDNRNIYGKCNNPNGHGHNYLMEVTLAGPIDPSTGMVYDLAALDRIVEKQVMERFDHKNLNLDVESFRTRVPTTENLCWEIFNLLRKDVEDSGPSHELRLSRVRLEETSLNFFECVAEDVSGRKGM